MIAIGILATGRSDRGHVSVRAVWLGILAALLGAATAPLNSVKVLGQSMWAWSGLPWQNTIGMVVGFLVLVSSRSSPSASPAGGQQAWRWTRGRGSALGNGGTSTEAVHPQIQSTHSRVLAHDLRRGDARIARIRVDEAIRAATGIPATTRLRHLRTAT